MDGGKPLSILHVDLSKGVGGTERYCLDLAERQIAQGHTVGLVAWWAPKSRNVIQRHAPPGLIVHEAAPIFASRWIRAAVRKQRADIVNVHLPDSAKAAYAARLSVPVAMTMHLRYRRGEARGVDGLICVAHWQEQEAADFPGPKVTAHNWPPAERIPDPARIATARAEIGAGADTFAVGFIARLNRIKRPELLIQAYRDAGLPNARLALIGEGPERTALVAQAGGAPDIRFLGHRSDVENWHRAIDLFVLPSDWEGLPLGVLEAMRAGTPILATASAGTAEALEGTDATLVPCGDMVALTAALRDLRTRAANGALPRRPRDLSRFDVERSVATVEQFYRQLIAQRSGET